MGVETTALEQKIKDLAESCGTEPPKNVLGDPAHAVAPSGNAKAPDKVVHDGGALAFDLNGVLGGSDVHGANVRVSLVSSGAHEDVATTWLPGSGDPDNQNGTGKNQAATGLLGQGTPSTVAADYLVDKLLGHGSAWALDGGGKPTSPLRVIVDGVGAYFESCMSQSTEQTGTGSEQSIAHGLGVVPKIALAIPSSSPVVPTAWSINPGTHDATNCKFTATLGWKYRVLAIA
jgi:hypothetical protein